MLGLNSQSSAQRLARLLLADPLGAEEQWEKELLKAGDGGERAVLLKYDLHTFIIGELLTAVVGTAKTLMHRLHRHCTKL